MKEKFYLPSDEMAFRKIYKPLVEKEILTTVFRPGQRLCNDFRGYCPGDIVKAKIITELGSDRAKLAPKFLDNPIKFIKIGSIKAIKIKDLKPSDFKGSSPDVRDKQSLKYHLGLIYNLDPASLSDEAEITRINFIYLKIKKNGKNRQNGQNKKDSRTLSRSFDACKNSSR